MNALFRHTLTAFATTLLLTPPAALCVAEDIEARFAAMTPAEVRAYELDVMRRIADLALIPPKLNTSPLPDYDYDRLDYGMTIGIERTAKGRLWTCWVAGGDSPKAFFVLATSDDDGETWSAPRRLWHGVALNKPTVLSTGEWMLPISLDQGATWQWRGAVWFPNPDWHEHMIVERKDGTHSWP